MHTQQQSASERAELIHSYQHVRVETEQLCAPLAVEDFGIQTTVEVSPPKWHLAHVSWFFETFLLKPFRREYREFHAQFGYLFNSYYQQVGTMHPRPERGLLSRPTVAEVMDYRAHVDEAMCALIDSAPARDWPEINRRLIIGLNHEQQHQELLLTDIKHIFSYNPLLPAYRGDLQVPRNRPVSMRWIDGKQGQVEIGHQGAGFAYDNEMPRHTVWLQPHRLANRLVTNGEYLEFIRDEGYTRPELWLADGWYHLQQTGWQAPLYWLHRDEQWMEKTLGGLRPLELHLPVTHVSYYEADAYARWVGKRLPTEAEWENASNTVPVQGNFRTADCLHPESPIAAEGLLQMFGDCWEWTSSAYSAYPGYRADAGALGEYNGKFMCNQQVLRGGSCVTPQAHIRASYRNFFYPQERWQFMGVRLAEDVRG